MKKKIIFSFLCLLAFATNVNAEELIEPLNSIIKDGTLYVDMLVPTNESEFSNVSGILNEQYKEYLKTDDTTYNKSLSLVDCSNDYSTCTLVYSGCLVNEGCGDVPTQVAVNWKEVYSDLFTKIAPNGILKINAIKPTNDVELNYYISSYFSKLYPDESVTGMLYECNKDYTECIFVVDSEENSEEHLVTVRWEETNIETKEEVNNYIKQVESSYTLGSDGKFTYVLSDLNKVNYIMSHKNSKIDYFVYMHDAIKYSPNALKILNNNLYDCYLVRLAANDEFNLDLWAYGAFVVYHNDVMYGIIDNLKLEYKNIIYIPDNTENTSAAYITAAEKRISDYLNNSMTVKVEVAGKRTEYKSLSGEAVDFSILGDESKMGDYYYKVTIGNVTEEFVIARNSNKTETPKYTKKDTKTNIIVSSTSSEIPLDTSVKVEEINTTSETFAKINKVLKLDNNEEVQVYDIKLYSESSSKYITKLTNGEFKVSVPIKDSLKGKQLVAYYVKENGETEEHDVTVVDGIATFTTNHFSIYTLAEKTSEDPVNEQVPSTGDTIINYVIVGVIGLIGLSTGVILKKKEN